jgi:uncharacterized membrane protein (UPF0127 family)
MKRMVHSIETGALIASVTIARGPLRRSIGLLFTDSLPVQEGMWFDGCAAIHTLGMRYPIDVIFLDRDNRVIDTIREVPPQKLAVTCLKAKVTIELGAGTLERVRVDRGDHLYLVTPSAPPSDA